jgi:oligoendopeptidase F
MIIPANAFWDMTPLYTSMTARELESDFSSVVTMTDLFRKKYFGNVAMLDVIQLKSALVELECIQEALVKPQTYAYLIFAANSEDIETKKLSQRAMEFGNRMSREMLFFDLELIALPENKYLELIDDCSLSNYRHYLESLRRYSPHTLPEREERILKGKALTGVDAFTHLFDELSSSFRYDFILEGEHLEMTGEELLGLLHHHDSSVRERALTTFLAKFREQGIVFSAILNNAALDHGQELEIRGYRCVMEPTHLANELEPQAVERLIEVSENNYHLARDYFRLKARLIGKPKLKNSDIYAPIPGTDRQYSFETSKNLVLEAYGMFSPLFGKIIERFFSEERIDVLPRPGKSGGAFCMGISPSLPPFVLLNHTGNLRDVATLAHELGHGLHFVLAQRQSMLNYHPPLPLAETASVFGEMLLTKLLLQREEDSKEKISILCATIEDIIATTFRQIVLTRFEERVHTERKKGLLSSEDICSLWWEENARLYGDSVEMIEPYRWGWSYISHFIHSRFYCYSYTFAELLVLSLFNKYLAEGETFVPKYVSILESGGSQSPADAVRAAGIDFNDPDFWQKGYDFLQGLIVELENTM